MSETDDSEQADAGVQRGNYRYATVVRQTMDDPVNNIEEGNIEVVAGQFEDGVLRTVFAESDGDFLEITGEQLDQFHADQRMTDSDIRTWGAKKAKESEVDYANV